MQLTLKTRLLPMLLVSLSSLPAQSPADPSGHWEGAIQMPDRKMNIEVDLMKNQKGELAGTISAPDQNLKGLPLKVAVEGRSVKFHAREDQPFTGVLAADGKSISGELSVSGYSVPLSMTRTGAARMEAPARSAPVAKEFEGTWNAALAGDSTQLRVVLTIANRPDGTSSGRLVNLDEGNLEIPVSSSIQSASSLTLHFKAVGGSYTGTLNQEGTELAGTYKQGEITVPLAFRRAAAGKD